MGIDDIFTITWKKYVVSRISLKLCQKVFPKRKDFLYESPVILLTIVHHSLHSIAYKKILHDY